MRLPREWYHGPMGRRGTERRGWTDSYTLLCERCGYVIEGLVDEPSAGGRCPECGLDIISSLPEHRIGTPWQNQPGLKSMLVTAGLVVRRPLHTLDRLRVGPPRIVGLLVVAALPIGWLASGLLLALLEARGIAASGGTRSGPSVVGSWAVALGIGLGLTPIVALALWLLTWIEARGLVVFGKQNGVRMHPELAHTIVRHGAVGWLLCGLGAAMALPWAWSLRAGWQATLGRLDVLVVWLAVAGLVFALAGFLGFEFFAWLGLRRCRFANRQRAASSAASAQE